MYFMLFSINFTHHLCIYKMTTTKTHAKRHLPLQPNIFSSFINLSMHRVGVISVSFNTSQHNTVVSCFIVILYPSFLPFKKHTGNQSNETWKNAKYYLLNYMCTCISVFFLLLFLRI